MRDALPHKHLLIRVKSLIKLKGRMQMCRLVARATNDLGALRCGVNVLFMGDVRSIRVRHAPVQMAVSKQKLNSLRHVYRTAS